MKICLSSMMLLLLGAFLLQANSAEHEHQTTSSTMPALSLEDMMAHMKMMNEQMVKQLGEPDENYDSRFIDLMIVHHQGAILMAKDALKKARHDEIKAMSQKIIKDQEKEIKHLRELKKQWYKSEESGESKS